MTKLAFALVEIRQGAGKDEKISAPGAVIELSDKDYDDFLALGAIREPNAQEAALYQLGQPKADPLDHDADGRKGGAKPKKGSDTVDGGNGNDSVDAGGSGDLL